MHSWFLQQNNTCCKCALYSVSNKWPRVYERVPEVEDVDRNDLVAYTKSRHQRVRDRSESTYSRTTGANFLLVIILGPLYMRT